LARLKIIIGEELIGKTNLGAEGDYTKVRRTYWQDELIGKTNLGAEVN